MENKWRAARYGLDGKLIDFGKQTEVPARDTDRRDSGFRRRRGRRTGQPGGDRVHPHDPGEGNGADRQLRVFHETGDLKKVVDYMIEETEYGLFAQDASASSDERS